MNRPPDGVSDQELHAFLDGELSPRRRLAVEARLAADPALAARLREYRLLGERLHARYDTVLTEPVSMPPYSRRRFRPMLAQAAALALLVLVAGALGWQLKARSGEPQEFAELVQPAAFAHRVYATDRHYPVEIPAVDRDSLDRWVSQRMHTELRAPDLSGQGLKLIGGRLLPSTNRMAAQFMYEDVNGNRLTIYIRRITDFPGVANFRYREQERLHLFYWIDQSMGYAVVGEQPATQLIAVANAVHHAMRIGEKQ